MKKYHIVLLVLLCCIVLIPGDRFHHTRWEYTYTLQKYKCAQNAMTGTQIFDRLNRAVGSNATHRLHLAFDVLNNTSLARFVWGVQNRDDKWSIEFYFYHPRADEIWKELLPILRKLYDCSNLPQDLTRLQFTPRMISIDIPLENEQPIHAVDAYDITSPTYGLCMRCTRYNLPYLKNTYNFVLRDYDPEYVAYKAARPTHPNHIGTLPLLFKDWRISLCVATKHAKGCTGIYCSGVPLSQVLRHDHTPDLVKDALSHQYIHTTMVDIGYDIHEKNIETFCMYGSITPNRL